MRTGKSISNIAYHRPEVFATMSATLRKSGVVGPLLWVAHRGEVGDKPHIHFVLIGGFKVYDTAKVGSLWGFDLIDGQKASVSQLWRTTRNLSDWLLYSLHDPKYLSLKGLEKEATYSESDLKCVEGDEDILHQVISEAREYAASMGDKTTARLAALARRGYDWRRVVLSGLVPMGQMSQAFKAWPIISAAYTPKGEPNGKDTPF